MAYFFLFFLLNIIFSFSLVQAGGKNYIDHIVLKCNGDCRICLDVGLVCPPFPREMQEVARGADVTLGHHIPQSFEYARLLD